MKHITTLLSLLTLVAFTYISCSETTTPSQEIISTENGQFIKNGEPYYYIGTNFWYGPLLGSQGECGDRERLNRELDHLKSIGVTNLRVLVGGEGQAEWKSKISPILQVEPGVYNDELLDGLDYFMYQLQQRDMTAVLFLSNAWEWSGGFTQYLMWTGELAEDFDPDLVSWGDFREAATKFVRSEKAKKLLDNHIKYIISRTNRYTNQRYIDDPAIFSWQLCNEPRAFSSESKEYLYKWVNATSTLIRSLDPNHMISTGSEGRMGCEGDIELFDRIHSLENISYINAHMWSLNWSWIKRDNMDGTIDGAVEKCKDYLAEHIAVAEKINKPLVFEEFGLPRDNGVIKRGTPTSHRDRIYKTVFEIIVNSAANSGKLAGCNFWAWGGDAQQIEGQDYWQSDMDYSGDPPQEEQGLNSVYMDDMTTIEIIKNATTQLNK
ncbi:MAG: beta-mannosidase [Rikenellaceae bacterium]